MQPRQYHEQVVHFLRKSITKDDTGLTLNIGKVPSGSLILMAASGVHVTEAFNGDATNTLDIGYSTDSGTNNLATLLDISATDFVPCDEATGVFLTTADTIISCAPVATASATTGAGEVVICYIPDTDG